MEKIQKITELETVAALLVGLSSEMNHNTVELYKNEYAPSQVLREVMQEQTHIGWDHLWSGRIAKRWMEVGPQEEFQATPELWAKKIVGALLDFGITLWKFRNKVIHGEGGGPSTLECWKTKEMIHTLYEKLAPHCHQEHRWLFSEHKEDKLQESHSVQVAWVDSVRRLYPI